MIRFESYDEPVHWTVTFVSASEFVFFFLPQGKDDSGRPGDGYFPLGRLGSGKTPAGQGLVN